jgi:hypothetical protein
MSIYCLVQILGNQKKALRVGPKERSALEGAVDSFGRFQMRSVKFQKFYALQ